MGAPGFGIALAVLAAAMLASQAVFVRVGTRAGSVVEALLVVLLTNLVLIALPTLVRFYPDYQLTSVSVAVFVGAGLTGTVLARSLYYLSIDRLGASRTEPIKSSQPLHATVVAVLVLGERVGVPHFLGILAIIVGIGVLSLETTDGPALPDTEQLRPRDLLLPLGAAFFFGVEPTFVKLGFQEGTPILVGLSLKILAATTGFVLYLRVTRALPSVENLVRHTDRWFLLAGVVNSVFLYAYFAALDVAPVVVVVPIVQSSPLLVAGISYVFLTDVERVTRRTATATVLVVLGAVTITLFG